MKLAALPVADLLGRLSPDNPRAIDDEQLDALRRSLRFFDVVEPIVVNERSGRIVGGHQRVRAASLEGLEELPVVWVDLDTPSEKQLNLALSRIQGRWDEAKLGAVLRGLERAGADLSLTGFTAAELARLLEPAASSLGDVDVVPPRPDTPATRHGDLIELGQHRLLCGDATDAGDVARLLGSARPVLMVTDPPYGVEYDPAWRAIVHDSPGLARGRVTNDDRSDWRDAWALFEGDVAYVWHSGLHARVVEESLIACGFEIRAQIIWVKNAPRLSRGHYHWQHEPAYYAVRTGSSARWIGDRKQTTTWFLEHFDNDTGHGTQKPFEAMARPIRNHTLRDELVYDPFLGSGTTLIAADALGRTCYGLEIDPGYCDVIVRRWEQFSGRHAQGWRGGEGGA